jgi:hypothetical protein
MPDDKLVDTTGISSATTHFPKSWYGIVWAQVFEQWEASVELRAALEEALAAHRQAMRGAWWLSAGIGIYMYTFKRTHKCTQRRCARRRGRRG